MFSRPPLNFLGNKKIYRKTLFDIFKQYPKEFIFVDLFGGSGYLSYIAKQARPDNRIIYNDFDHYSERVAHIEETQKILNEIKSITEEAGIEYNKKMDNETADRIKQLLKDKEQKGEFIDWITISSQICFSMNIKKTSEDFDKSTLYNRLKKKPLESASDYLNGLEIVHKDWRELYNEFKDEDDIVFLIDPPYPNTLTDQYNSDISIDDSLLLLDILHNKKNVYYFTCSKSWILTLYKWKYSKIDTEMITNRIGGGQHKPYDDICLYKQQINHNRIDKMEQKD